MKERDRITLKLLEVTDGINIAPFCPHKSLYKNKPEFLTGIEIDDIYLTRTYDEKWIIFLYNPYELNVSLVGILPTIKPNFRGASLEIVFAFFDELAAGNHQSLIFSIYFNKAYALLRDKLEALITALSTTGSSRQHNSRT